MATLVVDQPIKEFFGEQLSNTEVPINTATAGSRHAIARRNGFNEILFEPAAACRMHLTPRILHCYFYDASLAIGSRWLNLIGDDAQALINRHVVGDTGTVLDAMQTEDFLYIASSATHAGIFVDMDGSSVNSNNVNPTFQYSRVDKTFVTQADTDGTDSTGTLAQDGTISLDAVPTDWRAMRLSDMLPAADLPAGDAATERYFWGRISVTGALSADVEIEQLVLVHADQGDSTNDGGAGFFKASVEYTVDISAEVGGLEWIAQGGAATTVNLTWIRR